MSSLILRTATRALQPLLLLFSVFLLLRGHHEPGGGFVGGLTATAAFALQALAYGVGSARRALRVDPRTLAGGGLVLALLGGAASLLAGRPFMTSGWASVPVPGIGPDELGTPLLFDAGVYLVVLGSVLGVILSLREE
jgi:multicomponent Na+:H+ antiporter subunit B